jgi:hypothetical protein
MSTPLQIAELIPQKSNGSKIASDGNNAETLLCSQENIRTALSNYFGKPLARIEKTPSIPHPKKSDNLLIFADGSTVPIQNKDGEGKGRGHSYDRRRVDLVAPTCPEMTETLRSFCLKDKTQKCHNVSKIVSLDIVTRCILGIEDEFKPAFFTHTITSNGVITEFSICPTATLMSELTGNLYDHINYKKPKRTCVHLSPNIYLQEKGSKKKDSRATDIQMKIPFKANIAALFTPLKL